jgi:hypothetical protein
MDEMSDILTGKKEYSAPKVDPRSQDIEVDTDDLTKGNWPDGVHITEEGFKDDLGNSLPSGSPNDPYYERKTPYVWESDYHDGNRGGSRHTSKYAIDHKLRLRQNREELFKQFGIPVNQTITAADLDHVLNVTVKRAEPVVKCAQPVFPSREATTKH